MRRSRCQIRNTHAFFLRLCEGANLEQLDIRNRSIFCIWGPKRPLKPFDWPPRPTGSIYKSNQPFSKSTSCLFHPCSGFLHRRTFGTVNQCWDPSRLVDLAWSFKVSLYNVLTSAMGCPFRPRQGRSRQIRQQNIDISVMYWYLSIRSRYLSIRYRYLSTTLSST